MKVDHIFADGGGIGGSNPVHLVGDGGGIDGSSPVYLNSDETDGPG